MRKFLFIAHRGNTKGPNELFENKIGYVQEALDQGFDVETDIWYREGSLLMGHEFKKNMQEINESFLESQAVWVHAKDIQTLAYLVKNPKINCFYHDIDRVVLTSHKYIWGFHGGTDNSIVVLPSSHVGNIFNEICLGICGDYVQEWREEWLRL